MFFKGKLMKSITDKDLLKDKRVIEEVHRHLWIESERAGQDIGFDNAAQDWLAKFSKAWMDYHMPKAKLTKTSPNTKKNSSQSSLEK